MQERIIEMTEKSINKILDDGIQTTNLDHLYKLVDIHKDAKEEQSMRYGEYNNYGNYNDYGRGYGNYGEYGRRGYDMKYRGEDAMYGMHDNYRAYSEGREQYNRGNYGAKENTLKSLEYMLEAAVDFFKMLKEDASSQEEKNLIRQYTQKISQM